MKYSPLRLALLPVTLLACAASLQSAEVTVSAPDAPMLRLALGKLETSLRQQGDSLKHTAMPVQDTAEGIAVIIDPAAVATLGPDGFNRTRVRRGLKINAGSDRGAMYGLLDLAQELRLGTPLNRMPDRTVKSPLEFRAIKFNLPWSAYRTSPALEQHQETCKDLKFWEAFLDMMVENRFNVLSLWSLHPYTYMIRPKNFPEACPFNDAELTEWKKLWSGIFAMAKERGIETYLLNWNIFVSPEFSRAHNVALSTLSKWLTRAKCESRTSTPVPFRELRVRQVPSVAAMPWAVDHRSRRCDGSVPGRAAAS